MTPGAPASRAARSDWTTLSGAWEVADGVARATAADGPGVVIGIHRHGLGPGVGHGEGARHLARGSDANVRIVDVGHHWALVYLPTSEATWQLLRIAEGGVEPVVTFDGPGNPTVTAEVRMDGNDLTVLVDGVEYANGHRLPRGRRDRGRLRDRRRRDRPVGVRRHSPSRLSSG